MKSTSDVLSLKLLVEFLRAAQQEQPEQQRSGNDNNEKWYYRFPPQLWNNAIHEFEKCIMEEKTSVK